MDYYVQEALEHTKSFDLPADIVREIWERSDTNRDQCWDTEEFANAMHEIILAISEQEGKQVFLLMCKSNTRVDGKTVCSVRPDSMIALLKRKPQRTATQIERSAIEAPASLVLLDEQKPEHKEKSTENEYPDESRLEDTMQPLKLET